MVFRDSRLPRHSRAVGWGVTNLTAREQEKLPGSMADFYERRRQWAQLDYHWHSAIEPEAPRELIDYSRAGAAPLPASQILEMLKRKMVLRQSVLPHCDSPIEADFAVAFIELMEGLKVTFVFGPADKQGEFDADVALIPQWRIERFRYDFLAFSLKRAVLIECDSKQFHSTEAQKENDRLKDEVGRRANLPVLRFTGAQLMTHAQECASVVIAHLEVTPA